MEPKIAGGSPCTQFLFDKIISPVLLQNIVHISSFLFLVRFLLWLQEYVDLTVYTIFRILLAASFEAFFSSYHIA
jgi:hypothetical protein